MYNSISLHTIWLVQPYIFSTVQVKIQLSSHKEQRARIFLFIMLKIKPLWLYASYFCPFDSVTLQGNQSLLRPLVQWNIASGGPSSGTCTRFDRAEMWSEPHLAGSRQRPRPRHPPAASRGRGPAGWWWRWARCCRWASCRPAPPCAAGPGAVPLGGAAAAWPSASSSSSCSWRPSPSTRQRQGASTTPE